MSKNIKVLVLLTTVLASGIYYFNIDWCKADSLSSKSFILEVLEGQAGIVYYEGAYYLNLTLTQGYPMGIVFDKSKEIVYIAIYAQGGNPEGVWGIAEINVTDKSYKIYRFPYDLQDGEWYGPIPWTIAIDSKDKLWISIRSFMTSPPMWTEMPCLAKLDTETANLTLYYIPDGFGGADVKYHNGLIWFLMYNKLIVVNTTTTEIAKTFNIADGSFMEFDRDYLWITHVMSGIVTKLNTIDESYNIITGLDRPLGLFVDEHVVYVAENSQNKGKMGTIAVINKTSLQVEERLTTAVITNEGPYHVLKSSLGNIWWTDASGHFGVKLANTTSLCFNSISVFAYFMTEVSPHCIWISARGSTYVGIKEDVDARFKTGDINKDGFVNAKDAVILGVAFGSMLGDENWNPDADLNGDNRINAKDAIILGVNFES